MNYKLIIIFCVEICLQIVYSKQNTSNNKTLRVIGGRDAAPGDFPYVLKMEIRMKSMYSHLCTCSLLNPTWSLTAAHCIDWFLNMKKISPSLKGFIKYNISTPRGGSYSNIISTFMHPNVYLSNKYTKNDVGLLQSEKIAVTDFIKLSPIDHFTLYGSTAVALGYGVMVHRSKYADAYSLRKPLQMLDVMIVKCLGEQHGFFPKFCVSGSCGKWSSLCPGDSGGPVIHSSGLIGINTAQIVRCNKESSEKYRLIASAGVITSINSYIDWIKKIVE